MKTLQAATLLGLFVTGVSSATTSQAAGSSRIQIDGTLGTRFGGSNSVQLESEDGSNVANGKVTVDSAMAWGGLLAYQIQTNGTVYLSYSRQATTVRFRTDSFTDEEWVTDETSAASTVEYFQFGGNLQAPTRVAIPYLGVSLGVTRIASQEDGGGDWARFNVTLDGGLRLELLPILDVRLFGRMPVTFPSTDMYCFSGRGCAVVSKGNPFVQGELGVGLGLRF